MSNIRFEATPSPRIIEVFKDHSETSTEKIYTIEGVYDRQGNFKHYLIWREFNKIPYAKGKKYNSLEYVKEEIELEEMYNDYCDREALLID